MGKGVHLPQLDSLRTLAVACVMWSHWAPRYQFGFDWGRLGVTLFFVLSGFLITGILLEGRRREIPLGQMMRMFYIRRALRILPLFYAVLLAGAALNAPGIRDAFWWHSVYLSNYYFFNLGEWRGPASHFWSVAVEEQFYMIWAVLMLAAPARMLTTITLVFIAAALAYRCLFQDIPLCFYTTPAVMDSLAMGALLAGLRFSKLSMVNRTGFPPLVVLVGGILALMPFPPLLQTGLSLASAGVILAAARGAGGIVGLLLDWKPLQYLGTISYGLYMIHNFIPFLVYDLVGAPKLVLSLQLPLFFGLTVGIAALSWHCFEKKINDLKRYFPYDGRRADVPQLPATAVGQRD